MRVQGVLLVAIYYLAYAQLVKGQISPNCNTTCGNITVDYPFGTSPDCYYAQDPSFHLTCNETGNLLFGNMPVINISHSGELRVQLVRSKVCYDSDGNETERIIGTTTLGNLTLSTKNKFTVVGCNSYAFLRTQSARYATGCLSVCDFRPLENGSCPGEGCCQTPVPRGSSFVNVRPHSFGNHTSVNQFNPCTYAFLVENDSFNFRTLEDLKNLQNVNRFPVVLDWSIGNGRCKDVGYRGICGNNTLCFDSIREKGYNCKCLEGFHGNPYLPNGCQDVNECTTDSTIHRHNCSVSSTCENFVGSFRCKCPSGYLLDTTNNSCKRKEFRWTVILLGFSIAIGVLIFIGVGFWLYKFIKRQRKINRKRRFFKRNGGLLFQHQLTSSESNIEKTKLFNSKELKRATENFSLTTVLGQGGQGTVYKGMLADGRIVAVKMSKIVGEDKLKEFINEVIILSQINHRNIVKLLGCCLETEVPLLVYEFIPNGNLFEHLHDDSEDYTMATWEVRLRIAIDIAGALSYLHSAAAFPIYHRDIKTTNIMLDEKYRAKVADFGTSRSVTVDHTHLTTVVSGTMGYVDPEYFQSSQFSDKSDVYSFGVVLVELITGEKPVSFVRFQESRTLATYFILAMKENKVVDLIDRRIRDDCKVEQVIAAAQVARRCLNLKGKKRPSMREVLMELERIRSLPTADSQPNAHIIENEEAMEINIDVKSYNSVGVTAPSVFQENDASTSYLDSEPLFPRQTW